MRVAVIAPERWTALTLLRTLFLAGGSPDFFQELVEPWVAQDLLGEPGSVGMSASGQFPDGGSLDLQVVPRAGVEPATFRVETGRSVRLS